jgi:hypothetical protein
VTQVTTGIETARSGRRERIAHAEDPTRPGVALCGTKLGGRPTAPGRQRCLVCLDLARRTYVGR